VSHSLSQTISTIFITAGLALVLSRLFQPGPAMLGDNDRSRWATVRALVDDGTYVIGAREATDAGGYQDTGIIAEQNWSTIDKVLLPHSNKFYSSKPPLLPTLLAGIYWYVQTLCGWSITQDGWKVTRCVLAIGSVLPLGMYLFLLGRLVWQYGKTHWGRCFVMASACFGTFITTFSVTLNNHTLAAAAVLFALYLAILIRQRTALRAPWSWYAGSGRCAGFAVSFEFPAALFLVGLAAALWADNPAKTIALFAPAAALPVAALAATNYLALGDIRFAYLMTNTPWYQFPGSPWHNGLGNPGIDSAAAYETKTDYALHLLIGHHGFLSLSPILILGLAPLLLRNRSHKTPPGSAGAASGSDAAGATNRQFARFSLAVAILTLAVLALYIAKTGNYGGISIGPRWLIWLTPLYLVAMIPAADRLALSPTTRRIGYLLLAVSVFSANYNALNPWQHPWIYDLMENWHWLPY
jgi:hypothetical protein